MRKTSEANAPHRGGKSAFFRSSPRRDRPRAGSRGPRAWTTLPRCNDPSPAYAHDPRPRSPHRRRCSDRGAEHGRDSHPGHRRDDAAGRAPGSGRRGPRAHRRRQQGGRRGAGHDPRANERAALRRPAGELPPGRARGSLRRQAALQPRPPAPPREGEAGRGEGALARGRGARAQARVAHRRERGLDRTRVQGAPRRGSRGRDRGLRRRPLRDARRAATSGNTSSRSRTPTRVSSSRRTRASPRRAPTSRCTWA